MGCFDCFDGGSKREQRREEEQLASEEARARAAEAAQKRQEQYEKSAAGRAARAQMAAAAKQATNANQGEPVLKVFCYCGIILQMPHSSPSLNQTSHSLPTFSSNGSVTVSKFWRKHLRY